MTRAPRAARRRSPPAAGPDATTIEGGRGDVLLTLPRGDSEELRVVWDEFKGHRFLAVRVWFRAADGEWRPSKSGVTIKPRELAAFAEAVGQAGARAATLAGLEAPAR